MKYNICLKQIWKQNICGSYVLKLICIIFNQMSQRFLTSLPVACVSSRCTVILNLLLFGWRRINTEENPAALLQREYEGTRMFQTATTWKHVRQCVPICYLSPWLCTHYENINCCNLIFSFSKAYWCFQISYSTQHDTSKEEKLTVRWDCEITKEP